MVVLNKYKKIQDEVGIIGQSEKIREIIELIMSVAPTNISVLIFDEWILSKKRIHSTFCAGYLLETAVTRVFIQAGLVIIQLVACAVFCVGDVGHDDIGAGLQAHFTTLGIQRL